MFKSKSSRKYNKILKANPDCCVIATAAGNRPVLRAHFYQLIKLPFMERIADRVARVREGWYFFANETGFYAVRIGAVIGPKIWTNAQLIEQHAIYATEGKALSLEERQREAASAYGLQVVFGRVN